MAYNKIVLGDETVLDLTGDTVTANKLAEGYTAHDASGNQITGTMASSGGDDPFTPIQDGKTRIYISLPDGRTSPMLGVCPNGTVVVDWGDGTATDTLTGTNTNTKQMTPKHNYAAPGDYVITLTVDGEMGFCTGSATTGATSYILVNSDATDTTNVIYLNSVYALEIGENVVDIAEYAFSNCYGLQSVTIPDGVTSIGNNAFRGCYTLRSLTIPDGVTSIGNYAFYYCYGLQSVTIPDSVTSIGNNAFSFCTTLRSMTIPDGVTSIGTYAFSNCYGLRSITIPDGVTSIGNNAFNNCYGLRSITIPDSVTSISNHTFYNCYTLRSVTIPDSVTSIGNNAFYYCYGLQSVTIPDSVTSIGNYAFYYCAGATNFDFTTHTSVPTLEGTSVFNNIAADAQIRVPMTLVDEWKTATNWSKYASYIVGV